MLASLSNPTLIADRVSAYLKAVRSYREVIFGEVVRELRPARARR